MSETPQETDAAGDTADDGPRTDADGDPVESFVVDGTFDAEDQHDAYKLLQAHFLALSRGEAGTLTGVSVAKA